MCLCQSLGPSKRRHRLLLGGSCARLRRCRLLLGRSYSPLGLLLILVLAAMAERSMTAAAVRARLLCVFLHAPTLGQEAARGCVPCVP